MILIDYRKGWNLLKELFSKKQLSMGKFNLSQALKYLATG